MPILSLTRLAVLLPLALAACGSSSNSAPVGPGGSSSSGGSGSSSGSTSSSGGGANGMCSTSARYLMPLTSLSGNGGTISTIVSDGTTLFLGTQASLLSVPIAGGSPTALFGTIGAQGETTTGVDDLWVESPNVFFVNQGNFERVAETGGAATTIGSLTNNSGAVVADATTLYFVAGVFSQALEGYAYGISSMPRAGGAITSLATLPGEPSSLLLSDGFLYWVSSDRFLDGGVGADDSHIFRVPTTGGTPTNLQITALPGVTAQTLAVDATYLYYSTTDFPTLTMRAPKDGSGSPTQVSAYGGGFLAIQGSNLYGFSIVDDSSGNPPFEAWTTPLSGGTPQVVGCAPSGTTSQGFAVDATNVYLSVTSSDSNTSGIIAVPL